MGDDCGDFTLEVGDRIETRVPPYGRHAGVVVSVLPRWHWNVCQYVVEWDHGIGQMEFAYGSGLEAAKVSNDEEGDDEQA